MGNANVRRYMGGKQPEKFFKEDMWPSHMETLLKLGMTMEKALQIFIVFCKIDVDESESVDVDEAFAHMGGTRTRFTERVFDIKGRKNAKEGLPFGPFAIVLWNFCTFTPKRMARHLFEIFDVDNNNIIERPEVESMYRMMYDCDDYEPTIIKRFPFDDEDMIKKEEFINHASSMFNMQLIKPGLDYQTRIRRYLGGTSLWNALTTYRNNWFSAFDATSQTLEDALNSILQAENPNPRMRVEENTDDLLDQREAELLEKIEAGKKALERRELQLQQQLQVRVSPEERAEQRAQNTFEQKFEEFKKIKFTPDDLWERKEMRDELYELFDHWQDIKDRNREEQNERNVIITEGTDEDKDARYEDYIRTKEGKHEFDRKLVKEMFQILKQRFPPREAMTLGEAQKVSSIIDAIAKTAKCDKLFENAVKKAHDHTEDNPMDPKRPDLKLVLQFDFTMEKFIGKKLSTAADYKKCSEKVGDELRSLIMERARQYLQDDIRKINMLATRAKLRAEFEIITGYGARETRWEFVYSPEKDVMIYVNVDTMQILPENTAICEKCDSVYGHESIRRCECGAPRSVKNLRFYKPLGY